MNTLKLIITYLPMIIELIKTVEKLIPESGKGKEKLAYVRNIIETASPDLMNAWESIEKIIGISVSMFNTLGVFKK